MNDAIAMTVIQRTGDLTRKLPGLFLLQFHVRDDIVQHLAAVDVFKHHIPVVRGPYDVAHPADIRMVHEADNGGFAGGSDFLRAVCPFCFSAASMFLGGLPWYNLDGHLNKVGCQYAGL